MIQLDNVSKSYGQHIALAATSKQFQQGKTTVLIGPSGCGKSTLLRIVVGLVTPDSGSVKIEQETVNPGTVLKLRRKMGYMIQDGGLFPHLSAKQNATLVAEYVKAASEKIEKRLTELCELARLPKSTLDKYPSELSGGQRQRVALIRALMLDPDLLLLDEPLGALDPITRFQLQTDLKEIFTRLKKTVIIVTHDLSEAAYLGDEIVLMRDGKIIQSGTIHDLVQQPKDEFVKEFVTAQRRPSEEAQPA